MTTISQTWRTDELHVAGTTLEVVKGGSGAPLLVLHDEMGNPGWLDCFESLATHRSLLIPSHPGFGKSPRLPWITAVRDLAGFYLAVLEELETGPLDVVGFSFGGWLAAAMASMCPHQFRRLVLAAPMGIRPRSGEIFDLFVVATDEAIAAGYHDPDNTPEYRRLFPPESTPAQRELWEVAREESCRLSWKPYMHDPSLPHLLRRRMPATLIIWGRQDAVVPVNVGEIYQESIRGARLEVLDNCGHHPEIERSHEFARLVGEFLGAG